MRLPRVRFTVGTFLSTVAFMGVNFWAFQRFNESQIWRVCAFPYRAIPSGVGVLPLFNVALVSIWLFAARRLRSLQHGCPKDTRSALLGVAYFSVHFLLLGGLMTLFMPDTVQLIESVLDQINSYVAESWGPVFGEPGGSAPWLIVDSLILGSIISGPPLLLSWIGQVLANRSASRLPRFRFLALAGLVELGLLGVALAICLTIQPFETVRDVSLDIRVIGELSGQPAPAAFVQITDPFSDCPSELFVGDSPAPFPKALTNNDGRARLTGRFITRGEFNAFQTFGNISFWGRWLEVSAVGHQRLRIPLTEALNPSADPASPVLRTITLARGEPREDEFRDLAGS